MLADGNECDRRSFWGRRFLLINSYNLLIDFRGWYLYTSLIMFRL